MLRPVVDMRVLGSLGSAAERYHAKLLRDSDGTLPYPFVFFLAQAVIPRLLYAAQLEKNDATTEIAAARVREWMDTYYGPVSPPPAKQGFLRHEWESSDDLHLHIGRIVELAELLYNLQTVDGIGDIVNRLVDDPGKMESTILELQGLQLLWFSQLPFTLQHSGADCEITLPNGHTVYCEMKCKVEDGIFSDTTLRSTTLSRARQQLPENRCGVIFLKIPIEWTQSTTIYAAFEASLRRFMGNTTRVAEIICYARDMLQLSKHTAHPILIRSYLNAKSPHAQALGTGLLQDRIHVSGFGDGVRSPSEVGWLPMSILTPQILRGLLEAEGVAVPDELGKGGDRRTEDGQAES